MVFIIDGIIPHDWWHQLVSDEERENVPDKGHPAAHKQEICKICEAFAPRLDGFLVLNDLGHLGACHRRSRSSLSDDWVSSSTNRRGADLSTWCKNLNLRLRNIGRLSLVHLGDKWVASCINSDLIVRLVKIGRAHV